MHAICISMQKKHYVSKTREVNENFKLASHMYLNEVFDYLGFPGYHSRCWQLLWVGRGERKTLKQRVKDAYALMDMGVGWGPWCDSPVKSVPTPRRVCRLSSDSGILAGLRFHNPLPSIPPPRLEGCPSLMQMRPAWRLWLQKGVGGRGWFKGPRAAGKRDQLPEKNALGWSAAVFCSS